MKLPSSVAVKLNAREELHRRMATAASRLAYCAQRHGLVLTSVEAADALRLEDYEHAPDLYGAIEAYRRARAAWEGR